MQNRVPTGYQGQEENKGDVEANRGVTQWGGQGREG